MGLRKIGVVLLALSLAGTLSRASSAATPDPKKMVLTLADLPAGLTLDKADFFNNGKAAKESQTQTLAQFARRGRMTGYDADFSANKVLGILRSSGGCEVVGETSARPRTGEKRPNA